MADTPVVLEDSSGLKPAHVYDYLGVVMDEGKPLREQVKTWEGAMEVCREAGTNVIEDAVSLLATHRAVVRLKRTSPHFFKAQPAPVNQAMSGEL